MAETKHYRGVLIDPVKREISEVTYHGDFREIYKIIEAEPFDTVRLTEHDVVYVDDEALLRPDPRYFFTWDTYPQPIAGKGVVLGVNEEGETVAAQLTVEQVRARVQFTELHFHGHHETMDKVERHGQTFNRITQTPIFSLREKEEEDH